MRNIALRWKVVAASLLSIPLAIACGGDDTTSPNGPVVDAGHGGGPEGGNEAGTGGGDSGGGTTDGGGGGSDGGRTDGGGNDGGNDGGTLACVPSAGLDSKIGPECRDSKRVCVQKFSYPNATGIVSVEVRGDYLPDTSWGAGVHMTLNTANNMWETNLELTPGSTTNYKFYVLRQGEHINFGTWVEDPANPAGSSGNSVVQASCQKPTCSTASPLCPTPPATVAGAFDWRDAVMYFVFVDRFLNGSKANDNPIITDAAGQPGAYQGGDYAGALKKLNEGYFTDLGVNVLWLTVPFDNPDNYKSYADTSKPASDPGAHEYTGYHGYWPLDQWPTAGSVAKRVEEHFGTEQELKDLVTAAHAKGIKILIDYSMVLVHQDSAVYAAHGPASADNWFTPQKAVDDRGNPIYVDANWNVVASTAPGAYQPDCLCASQVTGKDGSTKTAICNWDGTYDNPYIGTRCWFQGYLPHWNYDNPNALAYSLDAAVRFAQDTGVDGYRLDAVKHISPAWYTGLRTRLNQMLADKGSKERFYLVGETYDFNGRDNLKRFVDTKTMLDGQFDFPERAQLARALLVRKPGSSMATFAKFADTNDGYYGCDAIMSPWVDNHDIGRAIHAAEDTPLWDEYSNAGDRCWVNQPSLPSGMNPFERMANAFAVLMTNPGAPLIYYGDEYGMPGGGDPDNRRMLFDDQGVVLGGALTAGQQYLNERMKKLTAIRKAHVALRRGVRTTLNTSSDVWVFSMKSAEETVWVVVNRGDVPQNVCDLPAGPLQELVEDKAVNGPGFTIPGRQTRVFVTR